MLPCMNHFMYRVDAFHTNHVIGITVRKVSAYPHILYRFPTRRALFLISEYRESSLKPGEKIEAPVELRDLLPTFLALNGCRIPEEIDGLSLLPLLEKGKAPWREYIDIEHSTAYWADNYWCALTDGKIKYIWFFRTGEEQLFDLSKDPYELHDLSKAKASGKTLEKMRKAMAGHLQERGEEWVKDGKLVIRNKNLLYSPNYPTNKK